MYYWAGPSHLKSSNGGGPRPLSMLEEVGENMVLKCQCLVRSRRETGRRLWGEAWFFITPLLGSIHTKGAFEECIYPKKEKRKKKGD